MPYTPRDQDYQEPLAELSAMWLDLYALTMAQTLFLEGRHNQQATFHAFIRKIPDNAAYLITAGQNIITEWLDKNWRFTERDIRRLKTKTVLNSETGKSVALFKYEFLEMLTSAKLEISLDMMPEGEIAFASEPIYKVSGPIWQCLAVEAAILNTMNSQSNFATYASILKTVANGKYIAEFGLRRAQGIGGLESTRGAFIGGVDATSNCWAETNYGIPTIGTISHAYIMIHETEMDAYLNWAKHNPHLGVFLSDTYDAKEGMKKIIKACQATGIKLQGFRQDSGNLGELAAEGQKLAAEANYKLIKNTVSNDLDSLMIGILEIKDGAYIDMYAVGSKLATCAEQPALGGVYKIGNVYSNELTHAEIMAMKQAVHNGFVDPADIRDKVRDVMKVSSETNKMTYPGELNLIRYLKEREGKLFFDGDTIYSEWSIDPLTSNDPNNPYLSYLTKDIISTSKVDHMLSKMFNSGTRAYRPIQPVFREGQLIGNIETVYEARERALKHLNMLDPIHKSSLNSHEYFVGVEQSLLRRQEAMCKHLKQTGNILEANRV